MSHALIAAIAAGGLTLTSLAGPAGPQGPTNLTLIEQTRGVVEDFIGDNDLCLEQFEEMYADLAEGFAPFMVGQTYRSSILEPDANLIDMAAAPGAKVREGEDRKGEAIQCVYREAFIFALEFELHEAHAFLATGEAPGNVNACCLEGDVDFCLVQDPGMFTEERWGVLPPGVYTLTSVGAAFDPGPHTSAKAFEFRLAALDHPLDGDGSGAIDAADLAGLLAAWGSCEKPLTCDFDANEDGFVDAADLAAMLALWGELTWEPGQPLG